MKLFPDKSAHANRVNRSKMLIVYLVREAEFNNNRTTNFSLTSDQKTSASRSQTAATDPLRISCRETVWQ